MLPTHLGIGHALGRLISEMAPAIDHLLGRSPADADLKPAAGDQVGRACILGHVERVFVAHVDHGSADRGALRPRADRSQQREWRGKLPGEVMHPEIGAVRPESLRSDGQVDRLQERVCETPEGLQWPKDRNPIFFMRRPPPIWRKPLCEAAQRFNKATIACGDRQQRTMLRW